MANKKFYIINKLLYLLFLVSLITSCGSYQYSGYINDGIYHNNDVSENYEVSDIQNPNDKENNEYYKSAFGEKALIYSESETNDELFTDVENYRTSENDSLSKNYGPWGEYKDNLVINIHSYHHDGFWSRWRYPNWMWNYGYGYGSLNVWGYGYNNYWSRPFPYFGGMYDPFNPFWGYYDSFYYGYGYGYGYYPWWRPYNHWSYYQTYGRDFNTNVSLVSGRRSLRNPISSRSSLLGNSNIRDRFNRSSSKSLSERLNRIDNINKSARINPSMYNRPFNNSGSSNRLTNPGDKNGSYNNSKPNVNYSKPSGNYSRPSNNNYKPSSGSNYSKPSYSRPSYSSPSSSSFSRGGGMSSGSGSSSRGGRSGK